eukprot:7033-Heterococcus_DN1.PRE.1
MSEPVVDAHQPLLVLTHIEHCCLACYVNATSCQHVAFQICVRTTQSVKGSIVAEAVGVQQCQLEKSSNSMHDPTAVCNLMLCALTAANLPTSPLPLVVQLYLTASMSSLEVKCTLKLCAHRIRNSSNKHMPQARSISRGSSTTATQTL